MTSGNSVPDLQNPPGNRRRFFCRPVFCGSVLHCDAHCPGTEQPELPDLHAGKKDRITYSCGLLLWQRDGGLRGTGCVLLVVASL